MQNKFRDNCSVRLIVGGDYLFSRVYLIASISRFNASQVAIMLSRLSWILLVWMGWNSSRLGVKVNVVRSTAFPYNISAAVSRFMFFWGCLFLGGGGFKGEGWRFHGRSSVNLQALDLMI